MLCSVMHYFLFINIIVKIIIIIICDHAMHGQQNFHCYDIHSCKTLS